MDDGHGKTVKAEIGHKEGEILKEDMLNALGLSPPKGHFHHHHLNGSEQNFLKHIYESLDERGYVQNPEIDFIQRITMGTADTIITFTNRGNYFGLYYILSN